MTGKSELAIENWQRGMHERLETLRLRAEMTRNPLYVWEAIAHCNVADYPRYPLPDWCLEYLTTVASMFGTLAQLRDAIAFPTKTENTTDQDYESMVAEWKESSKIDADKALKSVNEVLGLSSQGKNAFIEHKKDREKMVEATVAGAGPEFLGQDPMGWIKRRNNVSQRAALERVRRGRSLLIPERDT